MSRRGLLIFASIVVGVFGLIIHRAFHCFFTPFKVEPHLEFGRESCTLLDVAPFSALRRTSSTDPLLYDKSRVMYQHEDKSDTGILMLGFYDRSKVFDYFRIHFEQPARVEGITVPEGKFSIPELSVTLPEGGETADSRFFRTVERWHPFQWLNPSWRKRIVFTDKGHDYLTPDRWPYYGRVVYSPELDFLVLTTGSAEYNCTGYLEVYRRRDHRRLATFRIESCSYTMGVVLSNFTWASERDFLYVTGRRSSDCFICRFEK